MNDNIALITENLEKIKHFLSDISVFRRCNSILNVSINDIRKVTFENFDIVLINYDDYSDNEISKIIEIIKKRNLYISIVLIYSNINSDSMSDMYQKGVCDFLSINTQAPESEIRLLNCMKTKSLSDYSEILYNFVNASNFINPKTGLYTHKALKNVFDYLIELKNFKNAHFVILSIGQNTKTKVSMNRLAQNLKKYLRKTDIPAQGTGKFYLLLPNTDLNGAKSFLRKISDSMGNDINIHAGITHVGYKNFAEIEKNANDSLKSAIIKNKLYASIDKDLADENWIDSTANIDRRYKLFQKTFENKLSSIIEPVFFRYERDLISKRPDLYVNQYSNTIESVFSLKNDSCQSELSLRFDGFAKFNVRISHKDLETSENSSLVVPLNKLNEKSLLKLLNKLYNEFSDNIMD